MLSPKFQCSLADAKRYFREHLSIGEYYTEGQQLRDQWYGKAAADLGLSGATNIEQFERLCENLHPQSGQRLVLRQKTTRTESDVDGAEHEHANRRVFYDFTISPPKSISIATWSATDRRIVEAQERAVLMAMEQLQSFASTCVRKNGQCTDRTTGNIVAARLRHDTSVINGGGPGFAHPAYCLQCHSWHGEGRWKALQNLGMLVAQKFIENGCCHELALSLQGFGYEVGSRNVECRRFSDQRHLQGAS
jgi:conjugative relaxase-like TrwC/TraI family protein